MSNKVFDKQVREIDLLIESSNEARYLRDSVFN